MSTVGPTYPAHIIVSQAEVRLVADEIVIHQIHVDIGGGQDPQLQFGGTGGKGKGGGESEDEKAVDIVKGCGIKLPLDPILPS